MYDKIDKFMSRTMRVVLVATAAIMLFWGAVVWLYVAGIPELYHDFQVGLGLEALGAFFTFGFVYLLQLDDGGQEIGKLREEIRELQGKIDRLIEVQPAPPESPAASEQNTVQETDTGSA